MKTGRDFIWPWVANNPSAQYALAFPTREPNFVVHRTYEKFMSRQMEGIALDIGPGSGNHKVPNWIGVDVRMFDNVDLLASATTLPFIDNSVEHIMCNNVLEHIPRYETEIAVQEMHRVLRPGGHLNLGVPKIEGVIEHLSISGLDNDALFDGILTQLYGSQQDYLADHRILFEEKRFLAMLDRHGFNFCGWVTNTNMGCQAFAEKRQ